MANIIIRPEDRSHVPGPGEPDNKLYSTIVFILMKAGVPHDRVHECLAWAFGADALYVPPAIWPARWNKGHPKAFRAKRDEKMVDFLFVVGFSYCVAAMKKGISESKHGRRP